MFYSALLRLPASTGRAAIKQQVDIVLAEMGLSHVAGRRVGTALLRGISGGERRRLSVAVELVTSPALLILDEPTTGLDASASKRLVNLLKRAVDAHGMLVIAALH